MFFTLFGVGIVVYSILFTIFTCISDCDLELWFYEKFGKRPSNLKGKVVFITGASSGIGEHTAYALAKNGVKLVLAARRIGELERVKKQCIEISKGQLQEQDVLVLPMDVAEFDSHEKYFQHAVNHFGHVDILLNNAGRSQRAQWESIELLVDKQLFDLNVFGVVNLSRVAMEYFNKVGRGHLAVMSSLAGIIPAPFSATYTASKFALHGYFHSLRIEKYGKNIDVTIICPGPTFSNFLQESFTSKPDQKYNISVGPNDKRMTAERCGYLSAVALANKTEESWIAIFPVLSIVYFLTYFPILSKWALKLIGPEVLFKLRDSKKLDEANLKKSS